MAITLRDGSEVDDPRLGRVVEFDPLSLSEHSITDVLTAGQVAKPVTKLWDIPTPAPLDQGKEGACFTGDVLIRMADGSHRPISDVRLLDEVVTAEGRTGTVTHLFVRRATEIATVDIAGHARLRCTPEHPILTRRGYVAARDLQSGDLVAITRFHADGDDPIPAAELAELHGFRGIISGEVNTGGVVTTVARVPELLARTPAFGRLIGLYAAEGCTTVNKVVWSFGGHEEHTLAAETVNLVKSVFDAEARIQVRPNGAVNVVLYGKAWRLLFDKLVPGTSKHGDKHLSGHVAHGPTDYLNAVLDGWLDGDGYNRRSERLGTSVSRALVLDMHAIATALGRRPALRQSEPAPNRHAATRRTRYDFSFGTGGGSARSAVQDDTAVWRKVRGVAIEPFDDYVYNFEVEGDHSYVADGVGVHNCVGFAFTHELAAEPNPVTGVSNAYALGVYRRAQNLDRFPNSQPGTSVLAGAKALKERGFYTRYTWCETEEEVAAAVSHVGPVVVGTNWHQGMYAVPRDGFVVPTGRVVGGHAWLLTGIDVEDGHYYWINSWGPKYGKRGRAKMRREVFTTLFNRRGEACVPLRTAKAAV